MLKKFVRDNKIHKKITSFVFFDYMFIYRPIYLLGPISMVLVGMYLENFIHQPLVLGLSIDMYTGLFVFGVSLLISCIFIKNEIISIQEGSNCRFHFSDKNIIGDRIQVDVAQLIHNCSLALSCLLILISSWMSIFLAGCIYFLWTSSFTQLNGYLNLCFNAVIAFLLMSLGNMYINAYSFTSYAQFLLLSIPYILLFLSMIILIEFPRNKMNSIIATTFILLGFFISYYNSDPLGCALLSVSFPFYVFCSLRGMERDLIRAIRYPIFLLIFFMFTIYPLLTIPMTIIYYLSKYYYWHQFDMHFPALAINDDYN